MTSGLPRRFRQRTDLSTRTAERWRPPPFRPPTTTRRRAEAMARRFADLQAGSIWRDVREELARCEGTILDVGCGAQPYRGLMPVGATYIGIDRRDATDHFNYDVAATRYYSGDRWPVDDASVDAILCTEVMEHVPDPAQFIAELRRCLRPEGRLIMTVPFAARCHHIPHDYWRFTPSALMMLLTGGGMQDIHVYARGNAITVACQKMIALGAPLLMPSGKAWLPAIGGLMTGIISSPLLASAAVIGNMSLMWDGGDDCLGFTVLARNGAASLE